MEWQPTEGATKGLGMWEKAFMAARYVFGIIAVFMTIRTLAPPDISWWQSVAIGAFSAMISDIWCAATQREHNPTPANQPADPAT